MYNLKIIAGAYKGNRDCFQTLKDIYQAPKDEEICLDFTDFIETNPFNMLTIAVALKDFNKRYKNLKFIKRKANDGYMHYMGFYNICNIFDERPRKENAYKTGQYISMTKIDLCTGSSFDADYENIINESRKLSGMLNYDKRLSDYTQYCFREMIRNVYEHSGMDEVYVCAQYWPSYNLVEISIVDNGCGVKSAMEKKFKGMSEEELLSLALKPGISAESNHSWIGKNNRLSNSGYGLPVTKELALAYDGYFIFCSGEHAFCFEGKEKHVYKTTFDGTAIGIRFRTDILLDFDRKINEILDRLERIAKKDPRAIKSASQSSGSNLF